MPHQCVRCNAMYEDGSNKILSGCDCGCKLFFFIKKSKLEEAKVITTHLSEKEKVQIEEDVYGILGTTPEETEEPVVLDLESIRILKPGKFELDLVRLFNKNNPLVYKLEEGKYMIDLVESFKREFDKNNEEKAAEKKARKKKDKKS